MPPLLVPSPSRYASVIGFSSAVRAGDWVLVAGMTAIDSSGACVGGDSAYEQTREALRKVGVALEGAGAALSDVVQTRIHLTDIARWEEAGRAHRDVFEGVRPVATMVGVARLLDDRMLVEIEATAWMG